MALLWVLLPPLLFPLLPPELPPILPMASLALSIIPDMLMWCLRVEVVFLWCVSVLVKVDQRQS